MLKGVGLLLLVACCTGFGLYMSAGLREREKRLAEFCRLAQEIGDRIRTGEKLRDILRDSGAVAGVFLNGYEVEILPDRLDRQDIKQIEEFFSKLGMGDTDSQLKRCEAYRQLFESSRARAQENVSKKSELYGKLGFFAGLFAAIILI